MPLKLILKVVRKETRNIQISKKRNLEFGTIRSKFLFNSRNLEQVPFSPWNEELGTRSF